MTSYRQRAVELIEECGRLNPGSAQVAAAQEAVRQADLSQQLDIQILARDVLIDAATFSGRAELSLVAFAWNLAHFDEERLDSDAVWYHFQWLAEDAPLMLATRVEDIEHIIAEMERVYELNGWYRYPVDFARFRSAEVFGAARADLHSLFDTLLRNVERTSRMTMYLNHVLGAAYLSMGRLERGVEIIARNFTGEHDSETEYPARCHGISVLPLRALGRHEDAEHHFRNACRMIAQNPVYIRETAALVAYAALVGDAPTLLGLLQHHLEWAATNFDRWSSMRLYIVAAWALDQLGGPISLWLHEDVPGHQADGRYDSTELAASLRYAGLELARRFDARHGTTAWVARADAFLSRGGPLGYLLPPDVSDVD